METVKCCICHSENYIPLYESKDYVLEITEDSFTVVKCSKCGLVFVNPRPDREEMNKYYSPAYFKYDLPKEQILKNYKKMNTAKLKRLPNKPGKILDIGCQKGEFLYECQQKGWDVYGCEYSREVPNIFNLNIQYGSLLETTYEENYFDVITFWGTLEHIHNPYEILSKTYSLLKPGGKTVILVTNYNSISMKYMRGDDIPRHLYLYTQKTLTQLMENTGFSFYSIDYKNDIFSGNCRELFVFILKKCLGYSMDRILYEHNSLVNQFRPNILLKSFKVIDRLITIPLTKLSEIFSFNGIMTVKFVK